MEEQLKIRCLIEEVALFDDQQAFQSLFEHFNTALYNFAFSFVRSKEVSEEILSDTFVNLWRNRKTLPDIDNLRIYLYVSVKNLAIRHICRNKKNQHFSLDDMLLQNASCSSRTPEDMLVSKEMIRQIDMAIHELPPKCKLIFKLIREDGLKYKEVSRILGISVKTIDAQMAIASKKIALSLRLMLRL